MGKRVFNNSNPANAFQVATSKQLLLERAQRLVTALAEKLVEPHFGYVIRDGVLAIALEKGSIKITTTVRIRKSTYMKKFLEFNWQRACRFIPNRAES